MREGMPKPSQWWLVQKLTLHTAEPYRLKKLKASLKSLMDRTSRLVRHLTQTMAVWALANLDVYDDSYSRCILLDNYHMLELSTYRVLMTFHLVTVETLKEN